jgi:hypothetical protein
MGKQGVKKITIIVALCGSLFCAPAQAKTFVGVLWPMFGPLPAIGLVELVAELRMMPDVEVSTYLHQEWPSLVEDIARQPPGTRTVVIGYSLGANSSVFVANKSKYVDLIVALQPSMLSWNPPVTGKVGRMIEVYNPNPWMTFGGMGSKKLIGDNIEYIENNDSHPGAQFNFEFRNLVKTEIAKLTADNRVEIAQVQAQRPIKVAQLPPPAPSPRPKLAEQQPPHREKEPTAKGIVQIAEAEMPKPPKPEPVAQKRLRAWSSASMAFLDQLSSSVNSGDLSVQRELTIDDMRDYAARAYHGSPTAALMTTAAD